MISALLAGCLMLAGVFVGATALVDQDNGRAVLAFVLFMAGALLLRRAMR